MFGSKAMGQSIYDKTRQTYEAKRNFKDSYNPDYFEFKYCVRPDFKKHCPTNN
ncbi:hypothetical protein IMPR6_270010 [Imperialibacter sp. EC-SDR9]|nr:hypothetical protein IMPERIA89_640099 [Imperialibacter sp. 89]VVT18242.1 hypothetical protein IMPR6_270010 [Imperialibacter sp. EC-SDR9]